MAVPYYGDYPEDHAEIRIPFNTFDSNDPSASVTITNLADADIEVHADGDVTQIATDGASVIIDFAGEVGSHMILIDSSVDAAYTKATEYAVKIVGTTIDGATVNAWVGTFSIERAGGALATALLTNIVVDGIAAKLVGITLLNEWLGIISGKQAGDATALAEMKLTGAGSGTLNPTTDSIEALRDRGDSAWPTATGFSTHSAAAVWSVGTRVLTANTNLNDPTAAAIRSEMDSNSTQLAAIVADTGEIGTAGAGLTNINLPNQTMNITGNLSGSVGSVTGAVGSVTGAVGSVTGAVGSVTGAVGSVASGGITAASFGAGAINAAAISTDAGTELADALLDRASAIDGLTPRNVWATLLASGAGRLSGAATTTVTIKNPANTQTRVTATVDADGNRSAITLGHTGV